VRESFQFQFQTGPPGESVAQLPGLMAGAGAGADHALPTCGYVLIPDAFTVADASTMHRAVSLLALRARPVFNPDRKRRQTSLSSVEVPLKILRACAPVLAAMHTALTEHGCTYSVSPVALYSAKDCKAQPWHRDFAPETTVGACRADDDRLAMACVASIDTGSVLDVVPRSHMSRRHEADPNDAAVRLEIPCGSVLLFHGALVHRGCDYDTANTRIHMYGLSRDADFDHDKTYKLRDKEGRTIV